METPITLPIITNKCISILSGGLDSTILTYKLCDQYGPENIIALSFNYKQRHDIELKFASKTAQILGIKHRIIDIGFFGELISPVSALSDQKIVDVPNIQDVLGHPQPVTYVPFRNLLFMTFALSFAEVNNASHVFIGLQAHDLYMYWDTALEFVNRVNHVAELNRQHPIQIAAPFVNLSKKDEIQIGQQLNVPFENTWTCYRGPDENGKACGRCPSCAERIKNFIDADVKDPILYNININW